jgi:hypothetical protein
VPRACRPGCSGSSGTRAARGSGRNQALQGAERFVHRFREPRSGLRLQPSIHGSLKACGDGARCHVGVEPRVREPPPMKHDGELPPKVRELVQRGARQARRLRDEARPAQDPDAIGRVEGSEAFRDGSPCRHEQVGLCALLDPLQKERVVVVPAVLREWCGKGLLTTAWEPSLPLDAWLDEVPSAAARNRVGVALFRFYFATLYRYGLFHADPHPGNFGFRGDGRVVVYDFGCVRRFDGAAVTAFSRLATAVRADDRAAMAEALRSLGAVRPEIDTALREILRSFFGPLLVPGSRRISPDQGIEARRALQDKRAVLQLGLPGKLLFLFRLRFGLYAVLPRIGAEADWSELESKWAAQALAARST